VHDTDQAAPAAPGPVISERVLIVEDDPATRIGLAELVSAWGFQTDEAANGEEAMAKITSFRPAIIVSDLVMPRMGGLELLHGLKDQLSDLTLILLTAQGTVESAVEAIKEGAYDYLSKPVDPARLRILLSKAVERLALSGRGFDRAIRVARTIADLAGSEGVELGHMSEALGYRALAASATDERPAALGR